MTKHLQEAAERHRRAAAAYDNLGAALDDGDLKSARRASRELGNHLRAAQQAVRDAIGDYAEPTHDPGAQTSSGFSGGESDDRALSVEEIRRRDRERGVAFCFDRNRKLRGLA
jgi:hypothetical protein